MAETGDESGAGPLLKNRYRLGRVLGRGGMCIVYQAWDTRLQRNVAVKRLEPPLNEDPRTRARFDREGRALAQLSHPNLVTLIDRGSSDNEDYLVFEYVEGRSLKEMIREGLMGVGEMGRIAGQVAEGLAAAHLAGIVHRDVKPQNILIDRNGHAKVTDFGIATGPDWTRVTRAGSIIGSARYMSPEQIRSKPVDARSDIYSLGVVMYEMLTGHPPFDGTNMPEIARMHLNGTPPPIGDVTAQPARTGLERVVMRCLEKLPEDRFASMDELLGALVGLGLYAPQRVPEVTASAQAAPPPWRRGRRGSPPRRAAAGGRRTPRPTAGRAKRATHSGRASRRASWPASAGPSGAGRYSGPSAPSSLVAVGVVLAAHPDGRWRALCGGADGRRSQELAAKRGMEVEVTDHGAVVRPTRPASCWSRTRSQARSPTTTCCGSPSPGSPTPVGVVTWIDYDPEGDNAENPDKLSRPHRRRGEHRLDAPSSTARPRSASSRRGRPGLHPRGGGDDHRDRVVGRGLERRAAAAPVVGRHGQDGHPQRAVDPDHHPGTATRPKAGSGSPSSRRSPTNRWGVELSEIRFYK